jgi:hypothetical protein
VTGDGCDESEMKGRRSSAAPNGSYGVARGPTLAFVGLGLFVLASDVEEGSAADIWGILILVAVVMLVVWIVRRVRDNAQTPDSS